LSTVCRLSTCDIAQDARAMPVAAPTEPRLQPTEPSAFAFERHRDAVPDGVASISLKRLIACSAEARRLGIGSRGRVLATRAGSHLSPFRGSGVDYDESRVYVPGDDPRSMDWRVTARAGRAHVKLFREERERPILLLVDQRAAMHFATRVAFKSVIAARAAALLGWAAVARGERVGGLVFSEQASAEQRPAPRQGGLLRLLRALSGERPAETSRAGGCLRLADAVERLLRLPLDGGVVFVLSDFADADVDPAWIARLAQHAEVALVAVHDPIEETAPPAGLYPVAGPPGRRTLDTRSAGRRAWYERGFQRRRQRLADLALRHRAHLLTLRTDWPVGPALARGLGQPEARSR
jgi:uncharacterized protein (DUF58 family)